MISRFRHRVTKALALLAVALAPGFDRVTAEGAAQSATKGSEAPRARIVITHDPRATEAYQPRSERVQEMVRRGLTLLTGRSNLAAAWSSLVTAKDVVGIKVHSAPGPHSGTRPAVVGALVEGLLAAKIPATNIIVWDRQRADLRRAGYFDLAERYGIRVEGSVNAGFDEATFYWPDRPILGALVYGDVEFERKGDGVGRRSFVSTLLTREITKLVTVTPLLNHNSAGVLGHLYSLAMGGVDNVLRFESDLFRLNTAVPEIYALPSLSDRVVLNVTDALICQYQGEQVPMLHYATPLNELHFSKDPVALDTHSLLELERVRTSLAGKATPPNTLTNQLELLHNASLLELGVSEPTNIDTERVEIP